MIYNSPFEVWCRNVLPMAFGHELSEYEVLCKITDELMKQGERLTEVEQGLVNLRQYVDNYFDNLDVNQVINDYIQGLIDNGTFPTESIGPEIVNYTQGQVNMPKQNFRRIGYLTIPNGHTCQASQVVGTTLYVLHHADTESPMFVAAYDLATLNFIARSAAGPAIHGNSMTYDEDNDQLIVTDTGTDEHTAFHYIDRQTLTWEGSYEYKGASDGNVSAFAMYGNYACATLTSTYNAILYKVDRANKFMKSIGIMRISPTQGNTLKQDMCANDNFFAMLTCNMTHNNTESPKYIGRQKYEQNGITIFDRSRGFVKNVYFDKYLGVELEGLSVIDYYVSDTRSYRFIITDLYGGVYALDTDYNATGYGNISLRGGLYAGIETPWVTFGGGGEPENDISYTDANGSVTIPNEFKAFYNTGNVEDTYISNMLRGQMSSVAFAGFTGILRQTSNTIRVNITTPKTLLALSYAVETTGVAKLSGYTYRDFSDNYFDNRVRTGVTYEQLLTALETDVLPLLAEQYGTLAITFANMGYGAYRLPRYYRTAVTYIPLGVED